MPRTARIDVEDLLYHVVVRGIERRQIFNDDCDRELFLLRLGGLLKETATPLYSFALIPNHFHLLLRRSQIPLATLMQRLLTAYAVYFNRRHRRAGHLFQNRYKAIICEEDTYFLELIRYINLNPIRAGLVDTMPALSHYRFASHGCLLGRQKVAWLETDTVLAHFGSTKAKATKAYLEFTAAGLETRNTPDFTGGGLARSLNASQEDPRVKQAYDQRILGLGAFVESVHADWQKSTVVPDKDTLEEQIQLTCRRFKISEKELLGNGRTKKISKARAYLAAELNTNFRLSKSEIARLLNVSFTAVAKMLNGQSSSR